MPLPESPPTPAPARIARAIRLTYAQAMLSAVFAASTGGMFLIGFAIQLGADNHILGLMAAVPQALVVAQFVSAVMVERGVSRKTLTVVFSFLVPLAWLLVALLPMLGASLGLEARFCLLIGIIALATLGGQLAGNARASWIGELVPEQRRGSFFGRCAMFAGIIGACFAVAEGHFLDVIRSHGLLAFTSLFFFGAFFGLVSAALNIPQPDCPLPGAGAPRRPLRALVGDTFRNRPLARLALVHAVVAMGSIAGPFNAAYSLRDVGVSFFGLGLLNAVSTASVLLTSSYWGRLADRFGCKPIMILGLAIMAPCSAVWFFIPPGGVRMAYLLLPWGNLIASAGSAAVGVAVQTMMYKLTRPEGRSVQFAVYTMFIVMVSAPMPLAGAWLVDFLLRHHYAIDLRVTFLLWSVLMAAAALLSLRLTEHNSVSVRLLLFHFLPGELVRLRSFLAALPSKAWALATGWIRKREEDEVLVEKKLPLASSPSDDRLRQPQPADR